MLRMSCVFRSSEFYQNFVHLTNYISTDESPLKKCNMHACYVSNGMWTEKIKTA